MFFARLRAARARARAYSTLPAPDIAHELRALLRETAQPVAVVTARMPGPAHSAPFHGATLSSFTSVAMAPHPLVAFALRLPSRMSAALKAAAPGPAHAPHMVVNLLCAAQARTARAFARPDLHPAPFASAPYTLSAEGLPVLDGALGALSCRLVSRALPLHGLEFLDGEDERELGEAERGGGDVVSELFIARVLRVERARRVEGESAEDEALRTLPLLYHRRGFTTCDLDHRKYDHEP